MTRFDFAFQASVRQKQTGNLRKLGFQGRQENIVLLGLTGVGKIGLAISVAVAATKSADALFGCLDGADRVA